MDTVIKKAPLNVSTQNVGPWARRKLREARASFGEGRGKFVHVRCGSSSLHSLAATCRGTIIAKEKICTKRYRKPPYFAIKNMAPSVMGLQRWDNSERKPRGKPAPI